MKDFIELAAESARELEAAYSDKPKLELIAWLQIALQRESMVATAYDNTYVEGQLDGWQEQYNLDQMVIDVVRRALTGVWAGKCPSGIFSSDDEVHRPSRLTG
jgi:hypothetical protein